MVNSGLNLVIYGYIWLIWDLWDLHSGYVKIAIENGPVEIVDLPIDSMVDLSMAMLNNQRVTNKHDVTKQQTVKWRSNQQKKKI